MIGYSGFISREWFLIAWGADTHTHTNVFTKRISRNQARVGHKPARAWFKNLAITRLYGMCGVTFALVKKLCSSYIDN